MAKYTKGVQRVVREYLRKKPYYDLSVAIVEYPNALGIRVFENNIMNHDIDHRVIIYEYLEGLRMAIEACGINCFLEGVNGDPPARRV